MHGLTQVSLCMFPSTYMVITEVNGLRACVSYNHCVRACEDASIRTGRRRRGPPARAALRNAKF